MKLILGSFDITMVIQKTLDNLMHNVRIHMYTVINIILCVLKKKPN